MSEEKSSGVESAWERAKARWPTLQFSEARFEEASKDRELEGERAAEFLIAILCGEGDENALRLFERHFVSAIPAMLGSMNLTPDQVDEVLQEVRRKLLVAGPDGSPPKIGTYAGRGSLFGLLKVTATRTAISMLRKKAPGTLNEHEHPDSPPEFGFLRPGQQAAFSAAFEKSIRALSSKQRNLLRLRFLSKVDLSALAAMYDVDRSTIVRQLKRARDAIENATRTNLKNALSLQTVELDDMMSSLQGQMDVSVERMLQTLAKDQSR